MLKRTGAGRRRRKKFRAKRVVVLFTLLLAAAALFVVSAENNIPFSVNPARKSVLAAEEMICDNGTLLTETEVMQAPVAQRPRQAGRRRTPEPVVEQAINKVENGPGYAVIMVGSRFVLAMQSSDEAQRLVKAVLDNGKKPVLGGQVQIVKPLDSIDILMQQDAPDTVYSYEEAYLKLTTGSSDMSSMIKLETKEIVTKTEPIKYETETVEDKELNKGDKKVIQKGKQGKREVEYIVTLENGKEKNRSVKSEVIVEKPVTEIVVKGTKAVAVSTGKPGPNEGAAGPSAGSLSFAYPVSGKISSYFGMRNGRMHYGLDIPMPLGSPVKAAEAGRVTWSGTRGDYGLLVEIDHGNGFTTRYGHNSMNTAEVGQRVNKGDVIALIGNTGNSSTPHCHFEIRYKDTPYNPLQYLK